jgi:hypothetical protein
METEEIKTVKVEFKGDEADKFKSLIKKINDQEGRAGFNNSVLDSDEKILVKEMNSKLNP